MSLLIVLAGPAAAQTAPAAKVAASIEHVYGPGAKVDSILVDGVQVLRVAKAGALLGFAEVRNVKGKERPITYLVAVDSAGATRDIDILVYREERGGEVANDAWRKQFRGKDRRRPAAGWEGHPEYLRGHDQLECGDQECAPGAGSARRLACGREASVTALIAPCPGARLLRPSGLSGSGSRSSKSLGTRLRSSSFITRPV